MKSKQLSVAQLNICQQTSEVKVALNCALLFRRRAGKCSETEKIAVMFGNHKRDCELIKLIEILSSQLVGY